MKSAERRVIGNHVGEAFRLPKTNAYRATIAVSGFNAMYAIHTPTDLDFLLADTQKSINTLIQLNSYILAISAHALTPIRSC